MKRIKRYIKKLIRIIKKPEMKILPGNIAFFLVLSIIPIITLIGGCANLFDVSMNDAIDLMKNTLPKEVNELLIPFISGSGIDFKVGFSMIIGFITASNGAHSIILSSNTLYGLEHADYLKRRIKALFLTILLVILFIFTLLVLGFGDSIVNIIISLSIFKKIGNKIMIIYLLLKYPLALLTIYIIIKLIYVIAPDANIPSKYTSKGSLFTTLGWLLVTLIYSYYVLHFSHYDIFYGGLANIIILMMWLYILSYIFVIGIAINSNEYEGKKEQK